MFRVKKKMQPESTGEIIIKTGTSIDLVPNLASGIISYLCFIQVPKALMIKAVIH